MNSRSWKRAWILLLGIATFSVGLQSTPILSADGTWTTTSSGTFNWGDPLNWLNNGIASGVGGTASFSSVNPTGDIVVNLDSARTLRCPELRRFRHVFSSWLDHRRQQRTYLR